MVCKMSAGQVLFQGLPEEALGGRPQTALQGSSLKEANSGVESLDLSLDLVVCVASFEGCG